MADRRRVSETAPDRTSDVAELWSRVRSGRREGHFYVALFGIRHYDTLHVVATAQRGISFAAFERFLRNTGLPQQLVAEMAEIPERTLARRKNEGRFDPEESDRLLRLSRIVARSIELFEGDPREASEWLTSPQLALGGSTPLDFARTDAGALEVNNVIGRLEHGIPT